MNQQEVTGALADGGRYRVTAYMLEVTDAAGTTVVQVDRNEITAVRRQGTTVTVKRRKGGDVVVQGTDLDAAGRLEAVLRGGPAVAAGAADRRGGGIGTALKWGCGGLAAIVVVLIIAAAMAGGGKKEDNASGGLAPQAGGAVRGEPPAVNIGEPLRLDKDGWVVTVTSVRTAPTVQGLFETKHALGVYLIIEMTLENTGTEAHALGGDRFTLVDSRGRRFPYYREGTIGNGQKELGAKINPGLSGPAVIVFDVPPDATGLYLETLRGARVNLGDVPLR
jgi:hypothetical protein